MTPDKQENPHHEIGTYVDCIVAYLDILGFERKVLDSQINAETLESIIQSLKIVNAIPTDGKKVSSNPGGERIIQIRRRFFSDTLVFFQKKKPKDIAQLFFVIRYLQDQLWQKDFCLRGSIVQGQMYWTKKDENVTVGKGLIDAYRREKMIAIFPRIVVSEDLYKYIDRNKISSDPFGTPQQVQLIELIRRDSDGIRFLDLLNPRITRAEGERLDEILGGAQFTIRYNPGAPSQHPKILQSVDSIIRVNSGATDEGIKQKYAWLCSYRNTYDV